MTEPIEIPTETAKAALAFARYVAMGPKRSIRALASILVEQNYYKTTATAETMLNNWSTKYRWQDRLAAAITEKTERLLSHASELDAATFLRTSELVADRVAMSDPLHIDTVLKARESVRRPAPKGGSNVGVNVQVTVSLRDLAERIAVDEGLDADELIRDAERYLRSGV